MGGGRRMEILMIIGELAGGIVVLLILIITRSEK
jgi:hypothetical protein